MKYQDLADLPEDDRIQIVGESCMELEPGHTGAFVVDDDPPEKVERYKQKLFSRFPQLEFVRQFNGPAEGTISVMVRKRS